MFFELNGKHKAFQKKVREVYEREVSPWVEEYEKKRLSLFPFILPSEQIDFSAFDVQRNTVDLGWTRFLNVFRRRI